MFILASKSPRRREILKEIIPSFEIIVPDADESSLLKSVPPLKLPKAEALLKVKAIIKDHPSDMILSADTIVFLDDLPLGKPKDEEDAFKMLRLQSGKKEKVITGFAFYDGKEICLGEDVTEVHFNHLDEDSIKDYIKKYQPFDKAGAYGIQDEAGLISHIEGSYKNVMGLPLEAIKELFLEKGII